MRSYLMVTLALDVLAAADNPVEAIARISLVKILYALLVLIVVFLLIRILTATLEALSRRAARARFFFKMMPPVIRFVLWIGGSLVILAIFAPSENALLAVLARLHSHSVSALKTW